MISEKESSFNCQAEATLIKQAQAGSQDCLSLLLLRHERLVHLVCFNILAQLHQRTASGHISISTHKHHLELYNLSKPE